MTPMVTRHLMIPSKTSYLSLVRTILGDLLQGERVDSKDSDAIILSVDEALSNVIEHAHKEAREESIGITLAFGADSFSIVIADRGRPFHPSIVTRYEVQNRVQEKRSHGYGLYLMHTLMDKITYERTKEGNRLLMIKRLRKNRA